MYVQAICSLEPSEPLVVFAKMKQECLRKLWLSAPEGRLSPWEQAKALALREASRMLHDGWDNLSLGLRAADQVWWRSPAAWALA